MAQPIRVFSYIDGFNLYFGLRESGLRRHLWLDLQELSAALLKTDQTLVRTKYFTSRISGPSRGDSAHRAQEMMSRKKRQNIYLEALSTLTEFETHLGHFLSKPMKCYSCKYEWRGFEEKMTDVNIATEMLTDAMTDGYDTALLISADSDLISPVRAIRRIYPLKRIIVALPPGRFSKDLVNAANGYVYIEDHTLANCQLCDPVKKPGGFLLRKPKEWN
jgi:uncharacterized LabA/DUF88 family protein